MAEDTKYTDEEIYKMIPEPARKRVGFLINTMSSMQASGRYDMALKLGDRLSTVLNGPKNLSDSGEG